MKRIIRATIGIGATIAIIFLVERTMDSFGFFDKPAEDTTVAQADSAAIKAQELEKLRKKVNDVIKADAVLDLDEGKQVMVKKIYKKKKFYPNSYMKNIEKPDSAMGEFKQRVDVTFDLDELEVEKILFVALEGYDIVKDKPKVKYFKPRIGTNRVRLKTDFPVGTHPFKVSYCYKDEVKNNPVRFYSEAFDIEIE